MCQIWIVSAASGKNKKTAMLLIRQIYTHNQMQLVDDYIFYTLRYIDSTQTVNVVLKYEKIRKY